MDVNSNFQKNMVEYLENAHVGEFLTGKQESVQKSVNISMIDDDYSDPTQTMPEPPPAPCRKKITCGECP